MPEEAPVEAAASGVASSCVTWQGWGVAVGVRCGDGSGVRVVLCIQVPRVPAGNGGDHGIHASTYI